MSVIKNTAAIESSGNGLVRDSLGTLYTVNSKVPSGESVSQLYLWKTTDNVNWTSEKLTNEVSAPGYYKTIVLDDDTIFTTYAVSSGGSYAEIKYAAYKNGAITIGSTGVTNSHQIYNVILVHDIIYIFHIADVYSYTYYKKGIWHTLSMPNINYPNTAKMAVKNDSIYVAVRTGSTDYKLYLITESVVTDLGSLPTNQNYTIIYTNTLHLFAISRTNGDLLHYTYNGGYTLVDNQAIESGITGSVLKLFADNDNIYINLNYSYEDNNSFYLITYNGTTYTNESLASSGFNNVSINPVWSIYPNKTNHPKTGYVFLYSYLNTIQLWYTDDLKFHKSNFLHFMDSKIKCYNNGILTRSYE